MGSGSGARLGLAIILLATGIARADPWWRVSSENPPNRSDQYAADQNPDAHAIKSEPNSESFWIKTTSDPVAFFTFALFGATTILGVFAVAQFIFLIRADKTARVSPPKENVIDFKLLNQRYSAMNGD